MDVSTRRGSRFCRGPELFGPGTLLDCEERCPPEWHARFRESGIRRTHLEFGTFRQDTCKRKSEGRGNQALKTRSIEVLMFSLCLLALGCGSDKSSSPRPASPLTGPNVGQKMPPFTARHQFGEHVPSDTLQGTNGTLRLFLRSAHCWPFFKAQRVQLPHP